ncbi:alanine-phosphoribitol ligase [Marinactinospora endophytica]
MSRKILIIGAGQSGLKLGHRLLDDDYDVTLMTGQTSIEIRQRNAPITQFTWPSVLELEKKAGLHQWPTAPRYEGVSMSLRTPGQPVIEFTGRFGEGLHGVAVDARVKMADWLEYFEDRGGRVVIHGATVSDLDYFSRMYDLVVVAVGSGELGALFDPDDSRHGGAHNRVLAQAILHDVEVREGGDQIVEAVSGPFGEIYFIPVLTPEGPATSVLMTAMPGAGLDCSGDVANRTAEAKLAAMLGRMKEHAPDAYEWCRSASLVDDRSVRIEPIRPVVRRPVGELPSGGLVLGMADVVVTSDPVSGQSAANSTVCADVYYEAIRRQGAEPFGSDEMEKAFTTFWEQRGRFASVFSDMVNGFWTGQIPEHFGELLPAVMTVPEVADRWIGGFDDPADYERWMFDPDAARAFISEARERAGSGS